MRLLLVHPSALLYSEIFLRLEPLGLERVVGAARDAGHQVRVVDLQVLDHADLRSELASFQPEALGISLNYLANIPEAIEIAQRTKQAVPGCFVFFGGHSVSFVAEDVLTQAAGAVDAVVRGEGEPVMAPLLEAVRDGGVDGVPGVVTANGHGPAPRLLHGIDAPRPARDLMRHRRRYFIGELDPCASIEFTRGCPWDCSFCSAWTFYGRSYRKASPEAAAEELASIREPNVFIVDDVAFIRPEHGDAIAAEVEQQADPQALLPGDPQRRTAAPHGGFRAVGPAGAELHVPRDGGARRGGPRAVPQTGQSGRELSRSGDGPQARHQRRHQPDRGPGLGRGTLPDRPRVRAVRTGDRPPHGDDAVSGYGDLAHRVTCG